MPFQFYFNYDQILSNGYNIFFKKMDIIVF